jgi:hypothetical protein
VGMSIFLRERLHSLGRWGRKAGPAQEELVSEMGGKLPSARSRFLGPPHDQRDYGKHASECVEQGSVLEVAERPAD